MLQFKNHSSFEILLIFYDYVRFMIFSNLSYLSVYVDLTLIHIICPTHIEG